MSQLIGGDWDELVAREGVTPIQVELTGDELACPACGTAAPLVDGACSDCGLVLER